ncbi:MAG: hypothetical protein IT373_34140 [Polyangiaceae bacterium]|nr:hypothetical protein [Polyangiaceae bacterium]
MQSTTQSPSQSPAEGTYLLNAVERILEDPAAIEQRIGRLLREAGGDHDAASRRAISWYSNRSALAGGVAAAPSIVPGWGTLGALGAIGAEMVYVLKLEVELCLALCAIDGRDLRDPLVRQLAFGLAAVGLQHLKRGRNAVQDAGAIGMEALFRYTPRELGKAVLEALGYVAVAAASRSVGKGVLRAIPLVGIGLGAGMNKLLTQRLGRAAHAALALERARREAVARGNG